MSDLREMSTLAKRNEITSRTKQNLIDAFWDLYCERRIERITVKDITSRAGYNRSTFYEYFKDPYDVLEQLEAALIPDLNSLPPIKGASLTLGMPMEMFMVIYEQNSKYYSVLLGDNGDPAFASKLKNVIKPILMDVFKDKPSYEQEKFDYVLEYTLTAMIGVMSYWFSQSNPMPKAKLYTLIHQLMEEGALKQILV